MAGLGRNYASGPQTRRFTEPAGLLSLSRSRLHIYTCTHRSCEGCPLSLSAVKQTLKFSQEAIGLTQLGGHLETAPPEQWGQWGQIQENTKSTHTVLLRLCLSLPPRLGNRKGKNAKTRASPSKPVPASFGKHTEGPSKFWHIGLIPG